MRPPALNLPPDAMPWGRWIDAAQKEASSAISRQAQDGSSEGSLFSSRADLIENQISSIPSVAAVYQRMIPVFQVTRFLNPSAVSYVYDSPVQSFNPPRPDRPYNYTVFATMDAQGVDFPFSRSLIRTNGVENMVSHENLQPGYQTRATYSIAGSGSIFPGGRVDTQVAIMAQAPGTVVFSKVLLWCAFFGSIL